MNIAIIAAAGQGSRFGGDRPKQFLELAGVPVIIRTLRQFERCAAIDGVVLVLPESDASRFPSLAHTYDIRKIREVVEGGATRAESVWRGLQSINEPTVEIVAVHDGVRPFVTSDEIERTVRAAEISGASILAAPVVDTIKEVADGEVVRTFERARLSRALTPQCFRYDLLRRAFEQSPELVSAATDDSSLVETLGVKVTVVEGHPRNIKITRPEDIAIGETILRELEG
ncbi:MAG: 2-C-methyl-D-erythritol 4-phosphate cytidylyltransferase [Acidobacteriota bacterium]|jgi:2-C-methyl-D-erythritol 4-phosphate cytidylyltransferase|nr:2-C-methyl-D-erythritol 4-phosphate cytidylyltransferase [Acidobacteriota bacterium]